MNGNKSGINILVVDDDRPLADTLIEYLAKLGYQAAAAYGAKRGSTDLSRTISSS